MRLYVLTLIALCRLVSPSSAWADVKTSSAWEVLEGCRLVSSPHNDGDSFKVTHQDKTFIVRLYFVDCPETNDTYMDRVRDQTRYFSIPEADVLAAGKLAKAYTHKFLRGEFIVTTQWADARGGKELRYFGLVEKDGKMLSAELVRNGLARIYGMPTKSSWPGGVHPRTHLSRLKQNERNAQRSTTGIWGNATGSLQLAGLNQLSSDVEGTGSPKSTPTSASIAATTGSRTGKLFVEVGGTVDHLDGSVTQPRVALLPAQQLARMELVTNGP